MKKYYVALILAKTGSTSKLALARVLIDMLDLKELYEPLSYSGTFEELEKLNDAAYFDLLEINMKEGFEKLDGIDIDDLKNYDVALALAAANNLPEAEQIMELFNRLPYGDNLKDTLDVKMFEDIDAVIRIADAMVARYIKRVETSENTYLQPSDLSIYKRSDTRMNEIVRWQDEEKWLYSGVYAPEKERWEQSKNVRIGFLHWSAYLSKYAKLRKKEIQHGNSAEIVNLRMERLHPIVWNWTMNWYNQQK